MDLYEHMGKDLFRAHGIATPRGHRGRDPRGGRRRDRELGGQLGRQGPGPGRRARQGRRRRAVPVRAEEAREAAERMLGADFKGHAVTRVLVEELLPIAREFYTSVLLDRSVGEYLWMLTAEGGMDIETLARERPEALRRVHVEPGARSARLARPRARRASCPPTRATAPARSCARCVDAARGRGRDPRRDQPAGPARGRRASSRSTRR